MQHPPPPKGRPHGRLPTYPPLPPPPKAKPKSMPGPGNQVAVSDSRLVGVENPPPAEAVPRCKTLKVKHKLFTKRQYLKQSQKQSLIQFHIYQTDPNWVPDPSSDRSRDYVQEVLYEEDPEVKKLWRLLQRQIMEMLEQHGLDLGPNDRSESV